MGVRNPIANRRLALANSGFQKKRDLRLEISA